MLTRVHQLYCNILVFSDACGIIATWFIAYYLRFHTSLVPVTKGIPPLSRYMALIVPVVLLWLFVFSYSSLYKFPLMRRAKEVLHVLRSHFLAILLFLSLTYLLSEYRFSRVVIGYFGILAAIYFVFSRILLRNWLSILQKKDRFQQKAAIIGAGKTAQAIWERMTSSPEIGIDVVGYFAKEKTQLQWDLDYLGGYEQLLQDLESKGVERVVIALARSEAEIQDSILRSLEKSVVEVQLVPDLYEYMVLGCNVGDFEGMPVVSLNSAPLSMNNQFAKRCLDFVLSLAALILFSPVFLLVALLIKLTSRGPIFYGQERMGLDGVTFKMWKFRSMQTDAEKLSGEVWACPNDSRRTSVGKFLRSTSLDELPQFWNVLKGDMSLVGPRPERPVFVKEFRGHVPSYMFRHKMKTGITGWAQINGWRGDTSLEKRIEFDLYYIRNWNLLFDLKILLLTPFRGFINKNAY